MRNAEEAEEVASILMDLLDSFTSCTDGESRFCEAGTNTDLSFFTYLNRQVQELDIYKRGLAMPAGCDALQNVDAQNACFQELVSHYMSVQCIRASVGFGISFIMVESPVQ